MDERTIQLGALGEAQAAALLQQEGQLVEGTISDVERAVPSFVTKEYPTFTAKHAVIDGDIVIQFFLPEAAGDLKTADTRTQQIWESFWLEDFRDLLSPVAQEYFEVDYPQIVAKYTEELASWWFRARNFGQTVAPLQLAEEFETRLNAALIARSMGKN